MRNLDVPPVTLKIKFFFPLFSVQNAHFFHNHSILRKNINPCNKELGKKNAHKRKKTASKRKNPLLELEDEDGVVVINDDPEVRTEANMGDPYTRL